MENKSLLKTYVKLVAENMDVHPQHPLELSGPFLPMKSHRHEYHSITREFPLVITDRLKNAFTWWDESSEKEVQENGGVLDGEHEIEIETDVHVDMGDTKFNRGKWSTAYYRDSPPDGGYTEIQDFMPVSIDGLKLSQEDAMKLKQYLGRLTDSEEEQIGEVERQRYMDDIGDAWADSRMDDY